MSSKSMATPSSKRELFNQVRGYWPAEFRFLAEQSALPAILTDPCDVGVYKAVEAQIGSGNEWQQLAAWAFHQSLEKLLRRKFGQKADIVRSKDVSFWSFDIQMNANLLDRSWDEARPLYAVMPVV